MHLFIRVSDFRFAGLEFVGLSSWDWGFMGLGFILLGFMELELCTKGWWSMGLYDALTSNDHLLSGLGFISMCF